MSEKTTDPRDSMSMRSGTWRFVMWFFVFAIAASGAGFAYKLHEFIADLSADEGLSFAGAHVMTYVLVAGGCICMLLFCFFRGHYADVEKPKYDIIELEDGYDRAEYAH